MSAPTPPTPTRPMAALTLKPTTAQLSCSAHVLTAYDATYAQNTSGGSKEAKKILAPFVDALSISSGVSMGFVVLGWHCAIGRVDDDSSNADDFHSL